MPAIPQPPPPSTRSPLPPNPSPSETTINTASSAAISPQTPKIIAAICGSLISLAIFICIGLYLRSRFLRRKHPLHQFHHDQAPEVTPASRLGLLFGKISPSSFGGANASSRSTPENQNFDSPTLGIQPNPYGGVYAQLESRDTEPAILNSWKKGRKNDNDSKTSSSRQGDSSAGEIHQKLLSGTDSGVNQKSQPLVTAFAAKNSGYTFHKDGRYQNSYQYHSLGQNGGDTGSGRGKAEDKKEVAGEGNTIAGHDQQQVGDFETSSEYVLVGPPPSLYRSQLRSHTNANILSQTSTTKSSYYYRSIHSVGMARLSQSQSTNEGFEYPHQYHRNTASSIVESRSSMDIPIMYYDPPLAPPQPDIRSSAPKNNIIRRKPVPGTGSFPVPPIEEEKELHLSRVSPIPLPLHEPTQHDALLSSTLPRTPASASTSSSPTSTLNTPNSQGYQSTFLPESELGLDSTGTSEVDSYSYHRYSFPYEEQYQAVSNPASQNLNSKLIVPSASLMLNTPPSASARSKASQLPGHPKAQEYGGSSDVGRIEGPMDEVDLGRNVNKGVQDDLPPPPVPPKGRELYLDIPRDAFGTVFSGLTRI